jgi:hypothetical protein
MSHYATHIQVKASKGIGEYAMGKATSIRINEALYSAADRAGHIQKRSIAKQVELWAELGKAVEHIVNIEDVFAVIQGLKKLRIEPATTNRVESDDIFSALENDRKKGTLSEKVTTAKIYYEASLSTPGFLDRVDLKTGERQTGRFCDGCFIPK